MTKREQIEIEIEVLKNMTLRLIYKDEPLSEKEELELHRLIQSLRRKEKQLKDLEEN